MDAKKPNPFAKGAKGKAPPFGKKEDVKEDVKKKKSKKK